LAEEASPSEVLRLIGTVERRVLLDMESFGLNMYNCT